MSHAFKYAYRMPIAPVVSDREPMKRRDNEQSPHIGRRPRSIHRTFIGGGCPDAQAFVRSPKNISSASAV